MAEDIVFKLEADLGKLEAASKKVPGGTSEEVTKGLEAAKKALNARDWDTFRDAVGKVSKILTQTLAATGNISEALQKAISAKEKIEKDLNETINRISKIRSKYSDDTMKSFTKEAAKTHFEGWTQSHGKITDKEGKELSRDDALIRLEEAKERAGGDLRKVTNDIAKELNVTKETLSLINQYVKDYDKTRKQDISEVAQLEKQKPEQEEEKSKLDQEIEKLKPASEQSAAALEDLYKQLVQITSAINKGVTEQKGQEREEQREKGGGPALDPSDLKSATQALDKQSTSLGRVFKQFSLYAIALRSLKKAAHEAVQTVRELDKFLTEQAMVTGKTRKEAYSLLSAYQDMASQLGTTTKEIAEVSTQFMRQGKSTADALTLTRAAISAAKVAAISGTESVNYLTTALNGFQLAAEDAMKVSDKFAAIAAQSATSYQEIATALSKVASQANIAGMSIDYTTALLAKGIETTREPAESIGTALKTIIARMREIKDYGTTLEDGTDINNVETQLGYVGIALRTTSGELRSTEEVLDELGQKWDTLSSNQQAAVAKALAGTRQQSRLIAMMTDYERVTELQQIAQRSAGATAAQAAVYMEGMEAALNKVTVAWEKVVTAVTDSDVIINLIEAIGTVVDNLGSFLDTNAGMITGLTAISLIGMTILGNKMQELAVARMQKEYILEQEIAENKKNIQATEALIEQLKLGKDQKVLDKEKLIAEKKNTLELLKQNKVTAERKALEAKNKKEKAKYEKDAKKYSDEMVEVTGEITKLEDEKSALIKENKKNNEGELGLAQARLDILKGQANILQSQIGFVFSIAQGFLGWLVPLRAVSTLWKSLIAGWKVGVTYHKAISDNMDVEAAKQQRNNQLAGKGMFAKVVASFTSLGPGGTAAGIALGVALATAIGVGIAAAAGAFNTSSAADDAAGDINELSSEIYKLEERANAIKSVTTEYEKLDNKIIKTIEDQKKMAETLDGVKDKLSSENEKDFWGKDIEGTSQQAIYENLQTDKMKKEFLDKAEMEAQEEANELRQKQIDKLKALGDAQREQILTSKSNAEYLQVQDALYAINNNTLYEYIDSLDQVSDGVESFTQSILENMSAEEAYKLATGESEASIESLVDTINAATTVKDGEIVSLADILDSDSYSIQEKIDAYDELYNSISALGDPALISAFEEAYGQWKQMADTMSKNAISFMETMGIGIDKLNDFGAALNKLGLDSEEAANRISNLFDLIKDGTDVGYAISTTFADLLSEYTPGTEEYDAIYNQILNAYQDAAGTGLLNMGQNLTSLQNQINSFYEKAAKWSEMSLTEQTEFIQDNYELFQGEGGEALFKAFETGDYQQIQSALATNEVLKEQISLRLEQLKIDLGIAEAATERNEAEIAWLKEEIALLEDYESASAEIYQASLELRLEQEQDQLDLYKEYLEKQQDALSDSLDKRKEAYENYFNAVNEQQEDEDFEEQADLLTANISKLSSSTDAESVKQTKELEQQLEQLEEERLQALRERAQEQILSNLDTEISEINDKFSELLENNAAMLDLMQQELNADESAFIAQLLESGLEGKTATEAEDWIKNTLIPTFDSSISSDVLEGISVRQEGSNLYLTLNNEEIELGSASQQELSATIIQALRQLGVNI